MVTQAQKVVDEIQAILNKPGDWTDEEINRLRALYSQHLAPSEMIIRDVAKLRSSLEMILAVRRFDKSSADLVKTTNKLTRSYLINACKRLWSRGIAFSALQRGPYSLAFRKGVPKRFLLDASFHLFMR